MALTIVWSAVLQNSHEPCVKRRTTQILSLLDPEPQEAAATALKWWLEEDEPRGWISNWDAEIGDGETEAHAYVVIHEPPEAAGCYDVQLERALTASGYPANPSDSKHVLAVLADSEAT